MPQITENQRAILLQLFTGSREDEIAAETGRKPSTIFNTVRRVRRQLGARTDYDLLRECLRRRIVDLDQIFALADQRWRNHPVMGGDRDHGRQSGGPGPGTDTSPGAGYH